MLSKCWSAVILLRLSEPGILYTTNTEKLFVKCFNSVTWSNGSWYDVLMNSLAEDCSLACDKPDRDDPVSCEIQFLNRGLGTSTTTPLSETAARLLLNKKPTSSYLILHEVPTFQLAPMSGHVSNTKWDSPYPVFSSWKPIWQVSRTTGFKYHSSQSPWDALTSNPLLMEAPLMSTNQKSQELTNNSELMTFSYQLLLTKKLTH